MDTEMSKSMKEELLDAACSMAVLSSQRAAPVLQRPVEGTFDKDEQLLNCSCNDTTASGTLFTCSICGTSQHSSCIDPSSLYCSTDIYACKSCEPSPSSASTTVSDLSPSPEHSATSKDTEEDEEALTELDEDDHEDSGYGEEDERELVDIFKSMADFEEYAIDTLTETHPAVTIEKKRSAHTSTISCRHRRAQYCSCTWYMKASEMESGKWEVSEECLIHNRACLQRMEAKLSGTPSSNTGADPRAQVRNGETSTFDTSKPTTAGKRKHMTEEQEDGNGDEDENDNHNDDDNYESIGDRNRRKAKLPGNQRPHKRAYRYMYRTSA